MNACWNTTGERIDEALLASSLENFHLKATYDQGSGSTERKRTRLK